MCLDELNPGGITLPIMFTVFFVHSGVHVQNVLSIPRSGCRTYIIKRLLRVNVTMAKISQACSTLGQ